MRKFKEILKKYPVERDEEYDHFAVVVRDGPIEAGLLPEGHAERYQNSVPDRVANHRVGRGVTSVFQIPIIFGSYSTGNSE